MRRRKVELYSYKGNRIRGWLKGLIALILAFVILFAACLGYVLAGSHSEIEDEADTMVILGCMVYEWGPSLLLQDRLDTALEHLEEHPDMTVIVSGGKGDDEHVSEARAMHDYLVEHGFPSEQIILEDQSTDTHENLMFIKTLMEELGMDPEQEMIVVSNGFHLSRIRILWDRVMGDEENLNTLAAPSSHLPSRLKMYIREPLALMKSVLFDR